MSDLPLYAFTVEIDFTSSATGIIPNRYTTGGAWVDVTPYVVRANPKRGREDELTVIQPGTCTLVLDNTDGRFDPDYQAGPYYGNLRPQRLVRISAQQTAISPLVRLWTGFVDSWTPDNPGGSDYSETVVECTDRQKLLARRSNTGTTVQEQAHLRVKAILDAGDTDGPGAIIVSDEYELNVDAYACRTLVAYTYEASNTLQNLNDVALSDGGAMFIRGDGVFVFQSTRFRTDNARATTSQGTFGNTDTAIPVEVPLPRTVSDEVMANYVTVTCGDGSVDVAQDATSIAQDGLLELDIGNTLLRALDGPDRAADVLLLRKDPRPRYRSVTVDCVTSFDAMEQALGREISDRITIAFIPPGRPQGFSRDQYVEAIEHDIDVSAGTWLTTFSVSGGYGGATVLYAPGFEPEAPEGVYVAGEGGYFSETPIAWPGGTLSAPAVVSANAYECGYMVFPTGQTPSSYTSNEYIFRGDGYTGYYDGSVSTGDASHAVAAGDLYRVAYNAGYDDTPPQPTLPPPP